MGIAQFMPGTAKLRGLEDPFHAITAIPASAAYLAKLRDEFGNLGLAAAAYNAGENRVARWRTGRGVRMKRTCRFPLQGLTGSSCTLSIALALRPHWRGTV